MCKAAIQLQQCLPGGIPRWFLTARVWLAAASGSASEDLAVFAGMAEPAAGMGSRFGAVWLAASPKLPDFDAHQGSRREAPRSRILCPDKAVAHARQIDWLGRYPNGEARGAQDLSGPGFSKSDPRRSPLDVPLDE
jgi:hypothetical protein